MPMPDRAQSLRVRVEAGRADELGWDSGHYGVRRDVVGDDGAGADDRSIADGDPGDDSDGRSEPDPAADADGGGDHVGSAIGVDLVVESGQRAAVADEGAVADRDAAGVLEAAAEVDEDVSAQGEVLSELAVERWEDDDGVV